MKNIEKYNEFLKYNENSNIKELIEKVKYECGNKSDLNSIYENENYQKIIMQGYNSIPYIFENFSIIWLKALEKITNIELYEEYSLTTSEMKNIWKKWASENGYL